MRIQIKNWGHFGIEVVSGCEETEIEDFYIFKMTNQNMISSEIEEEPSPSPTMFEELTTPNKEIP